MHATCVAVDGHGLLILGPSGAGKSSLALQIIGYGAGLVADDLVRLERQGARVIATSPNPDVPGIEARGIGILTVPLAGPVPVAAVVDLERVETARLPDKNRMIEICGVPRPLLFRSEGPQFAAALTLYLRALT